MAQGQQSKPGWIGWARCLALAGALSISALSAIGRA